MYFVVRRLFFLKIGSAAILMGVMVSSLSSFALPQKWNYIDVGHRFSLIALKEAEKPSGYWDPAQRDCAGFVRYVYRKALGVTEPLWFDGLGQLNHFSSAQNLVQANFRFLGRNLSALQERSGDVLVFYNGEQEPDSRYHLMLLVQSPLTNGQRTLVIYHNGATGIAGKIRKSWLSDLKQNAGYDWRVEETNPRFKGVYRWNGWSL